MLLITDIDLAGSERFNDVRYVKCGINAFLRDPQKVMGAVRKMFFAPQHTQVILD